MNPKNVQIFVEDLEETLLRLHNQLRNWEEKYDQFQKKSFFKKKEMQEDFRRYTYYQGKFYAYYYVLLRFGSSVPSVLKRLRGIEMTSSIVTESKMHYTEIYGHFPSKAFLNVKKVVK